ncbi:PAS domain S-box protein [Spizellomyces punctatus DAOM BR117]|uniref:PAS domain S-box protein n=1 Tax=Spizellomyces punctatus (strain DAOM BR117) TaxID=645134 RepID=A0A0L0HC53_SPIPD|nr:PAS domain S-box protein [Spizellomyces punctatus DAOM BR117]KNC98464.1 PAS domain S-box protein [Spizellomyces punctatus DAOM BR117]|eukprot:XP_016606504.1 PAS domain S-box protein [Spizellomyces punctatus DAOM BR117]
MDDYNQGFPSSYVPPPMYTTPMPDPMGHVRPDTFLDPLRMPLEMERGVYYGRDPQADVMGRWSGYDPPRMDPPLPARGFQSPLFDMQAPLTRPFRISLTDSCDHDTSDVRSETSSHAQTGSEDSSQTQKTLLSRHVTSVISHFTSNKAGYKRLLHELDDFIHVTSPSGQILYTSPSVRRMLGYTPTELVNMNISKILHRDDRQHVLNTLTASLLHPIDQTLYARYQKKAGDFILLHVKSKPLVNDASTCIVHTGREYRSKASISIDSLLEYRIENLRLRRLLEKAVRERGGDPEHHPLLRKKGQGIVTAVELEEEADESVVVDDKRDKGAKRKKKSRVPTEELFCRQCGTTQSPEWRKGPSGPKTLCNACGLAFSKKQRKLERDNKPEDGVG